MCKLVTLYIHYVFANGVHCTGTNYDLGIFKQHREAYKQMFIMVKSYVVFIKLLLRIISMSGIVLNFNHCNLNYLF